MLAKLLTLSIVLVTIIINPSAHAGISILPAPLEISEEDGAFTLNPKTSIIYKGDQAKGVAEYLQSELQPATGFPLDIRSRSWSRKNTILLMIDDEQKGLGDEGYVLEVDPKGIVIRAITDDGLFYGVQTLRQLLPPEIMGADQAKGVDWTVPSVSILDQPRLNWRGMHLDVARHFFTVDEVKKYMDLLAFYKMNVLHLHLTDDQGWRIEIKKYPRLTEIGSVRAESPKPGNRNQGDGKPYGPFFYTQEDIREIVSYAQSRHITVVPEIELPGHSLAALEAYPELGCTGGPYKVRTRWGIEPDIYCAGKEKVFEVLEDVLAETIELFPSKIIHIGGDEAPKQRWEKCPKCQARMKQEGLKNTHELQSYFVQRIEKFLNSKGRRIIGWDEILEGGLR